MYGKRPYPSLAHTPIDEIMHGGPLIVHQYVGLRAPTSSAQTCRNSDYRYAPYGRFGRMIDPGSSSSSDGDSDSDEEENSVETGSSRVGYQARTPAPLPIQYLRFPGLTVESLRLKREEEEEDMKEIEEVTTLLVPSDDDEEGSVRRALPHNQISQRPTHSHCSDQKPQNQPHVPTTPGDPNLVGRRTKSPPTHGQGQLFRDPNSGKVLKPIGEAGRPGRGGYTLELTLYSDGWTSGRFKHFKVSV